MKKEEVIRVFVSMLKMLGKCMNTHLKNLNNLNNLETKKTLFQFIFFTSDQI